MDEQEHFAHLWVSTVRFGLYKGFLEHHFEHGYSISTATWDHVFFNIKNRNHEEDK